MSRPSKPFSFKHPTPWHDLIDSALLLALVLTIMYTLDQAAC